ncbi:MAG TPA: hypothetical protein VK030_05840 [Actinomycetales bacterium]|nr:hypothetical protein [Actinomycetales bacterium]
MNEPRKPRRPAMLSPEEAQMIPGGSDPAQRSEAAHMTARAIVHQGRETDDPQIVARLVRLVEIEGLEVVADMWSDSPAQTLPGALWRLYQLREWVGREPETIARRYRDGLERAEVAGVVAGVGTPPSPQAVRELADSVLSGVYNADLAVALERAGAFCRVLATGVALNADTADASAKGDFSEDPGRYLTRRAGALMTMAEELENAAQLWRAGRLD